jgi:hypothetical protein
MSEAAFQSAFVRLITDVGFRDMFRAGGAAPIATDGLTQAEARDLAKLANSPGLDVMRKLHLGFRLNKLFSTLPLTCRLLGNQRLAEEAGRFWQARPSSSFYFVEEAEAFIDYLYSRLDEGMRVSYLSDVLAYEAALLILRRPRQPEEEPTAVTVEFRNDPQVLLSALQSGERPRRVPRRRTLLLGSLDERGEVRWTMALPVLAESGMRPRSSAGVAASRNQLFPVPAQPPPTCPR